MGAPIFGVQEPAVKQARPTDLIVEAAVSVPQVVEYLEQLVAALKSGAVHVNIGAQELVLGPRGVLGLKLRARQKGKRQRLALELTWRKKLVTPDEDLGLEIRAAPPAAPEAIEVIDLDAADSDATEVAALGRDGDVGEHGADAAAGKGEAHEGELATRAGPDDGSSA